MALLSRKVDYALLILSYLHHRPEGGCAARSPNASPWPAVRRQHPQALVRHGLCGRPSRRQGRLRAAAAGGTGVPGRIDGIAGRTVPSGGVQPGGRRYGVYPFGLCPVRNAVGRLHQRLLDVLRTVTLAELFEPEGDAGCTQFGLKVCVREGSWQYAVSNVQNVPFTWTTTPPRGSIRACWRRCCRISPSTTATPPADSTSSAGRPRRRWTRRREQVAGLIGAERAGDRFHQRRHREQQPRPQGRGRRCTARRAIT